jgi:hypothetical protein
VPNTKRKFDNKGIKDLVKDDSRFEVTGKSPEYLQIKEN